MHTPLEVHCDVPAREAKELEETNLNVNAKEFRLRRNATAKADALILDINAIVDDQSDI